VAAGTWLVLPVVTSNGEPRCPTCAGPLGDRGPRERLSEIVVAGRRRAAGEGVTTAYRTDS